MKYLRLGEVAQLMNLPVRSLRLLIHSDPLFPVIELRPRTRRIPADQLAVYLNAHQRGTERPTAAPVEVQK